MGSGQWAIGSGQWAVGSGQWAMGSGQWAVGNRQWAVGNGQWAMGNKKRNDRKVVLFFCRGLHQRFVHGRGTRCSMEHFVFTFIF